MFYLQTETRRSDQLNQLNRPNRPGSWLTVGNTKSRIQSPGAESRYPRPHCFLAKSNGYGGRRLVAGGGLKGTPQTNTPHISHFALILAFVSFASCGSWQQVICITISGLWFDFQWMLGLVWGYLVTWLRPWHSQAASDSSLSQRLSGSRMAL